MGFIIFAIVDIKERRNESRVKIVDCYDENHNKILDMKCEEKKEPLWASYTIGLIVLMAVLNFCNYIIKQFN